MPSFGAADRSRLYHFASDHRIWFQDWLLEPVRRTLGGRVPTALTNLYSEMYDLENQLGRQLDQPIEIDARYAPLLKRVLLCQRQLLAEKHEELRSRTTSSEIRKVLEMETEPLTRLMSEDWFQSTHALRMPRLADFLTLQDAYEALPVRLPAFDSVYEEKFRILQSPASFLPHLHRSRIESWLRDTNITVAFIDIDDFKAFNTTYTESVVDRDLLPRLMQTIEAHVYSHGHGYRFGGDEYILLLPNMNATFAEQFLRKLQSGLSALEVTGITETVTVSIGVCHITPDSYLTDREVQEKANLAKEHAKRAGKNRIAGFKGDSFKDDDLYILGS